jgi:hypothetical protein
MAAMNIVSAGGFSGISFYLRRCPQGVASVLCKKTTIFGSRRSKLDHLTVRFQTTKQENERDPTFSSDRTVTGARARPRRRGTRGSRRRNLVVVGVLDFLAPVREVAQDADAVLDALVVNVGLPDRALDYVQQRVDEALALAQLFPRVLPG